MDYRVRLIAEPPDGRRLPGVAGFDTALCNRSDTTTHTFDPLTQLRGRLLIGYQLATGPQNAVWPRQ